jgi:serine/threonine protein phosphatase 1|tara:strand:+ start:8330 stop:9115 length:786 start_codon:yes stop_codon:yes gene_type:complete
MPLARLNKFISRRSAVIPEGPVSSATAAMPEGQRAYVVGDIHGREDLLTPLLGKIDEEESRRTSADTHLIFLGDYVDRGPMSSQVIDKLLNLDGSNKKIITLKGNHEASMLSFLQDPVKGKRWLHYGGDATLRSYGVDLKLAEVTEEDIRKAARALKKTLPDSHLQFLGTLETSHTLGDYFFAHAGIDPSRSLENQKETDLLWIRDTFLCHEGLFDKVVVHGHSIIPEPEIRENRIGIDTGAFYSNVLTCLVLEGNTQEIL